VFAYELTCDANVFVEERKQIMDFVYVRVMSCVGSEEGFIPVSRLCDEVENSVPLALIMQVPHACSMGSRGTRLSHAPPQACWCLSRSPATLAYSSTTRSLSMRPPVLVLLSLTDAVDGLSSAL
jgi:di/tricarboxylate transporter